MRYFGGKSRVGAKVAAVINDAARGRPVWEPFCGACGVTQYLRGPVVATDIHPELIAMWQRLQDGWVPPARVTLAEYDAARHGEVDAALRAFIGFGCSFSGKWFGGFARGAQHADRKNTARNYAENARNGLLRKLHRLPPGTVFTVADFYARVPSEPVIYCDPPFAGTAAFPGCPPWDSQAFVAHCEGLVARGHEVFVSEYTAPPNWVKIAVIRTKRGRRLGQGTTSGRTLRYVGDQASHVADESVDAQESVYQVTSR